MRRCPVLVIALLPLLLGGAAPRRARITMWFWGATAEYRAALDAALVQPFNTTQDRYTLAVEYRASVDNDVRIAVMGGSGPDLIYTSGPTDVTPLARAGKLADLSGYARQYGWEQRLLPPVLDSCRQSGRLVCLPLSIESDGLFYSRSLFAAQGWTPPVDGAGAERLMQAAVKLGLYPSVTGNHGWQPVNENYADIFLNEYVGPDALACLLDGHGDWTSPDMLTSMQALDRWYRRGYLGGGDYFSLDFDKSMSLLHDHRAAMMLAPSILFQWAPTYFTTGEGDDLAFAPMPRLSSAASFPLFDIGVAFTYSINASSSVKDGAAAVLDRMLSPDFITRIATVWPGYWAPPLRAFPSASGSTGIARSFLSAMQEITAATAHGSYGFRVGTYFPPATRDVFIRDLEAMWIGEETPMELLEKARRTFANEQELGLTRRVAVPDGHDCASTDANAAAN